MSIMMESPLLHGLCERGCFESTVRSASDHTSTATELLATSPRGVCWRALWHTADIAIKARVGDVGAARVLPPHPHIVHVFARTKANVHGSGEDCLLEMRELCMGGSVFDLIGAGSVPTEHPPSQQLSPRPPLEPELVQMMRWFRQIAFAVQHCHSHGVVCGQLRREHLQLTGDGDVQLLGFQHTCAERMISA